LVDGLVQVKIGQVEGGQIGVSPALDLSAGTSVDHHGYADHLSSGLGQRVDSLQHRIARGRSVFDGQHSLAGDVGSFDPALEAVGLGLLADDERVKCLTSTGGGVHHRGRNWVGPERETANGREVQVLGQVKHDPASQRSSDAVKQHSPQVNVPIGVMARRENYLSMDDPLRLDLGKKLSPVGQRRPRSTR
jgi:hypothetical protein